MCHRSKLDDDRWISLAALATVPHAIPGYDDADDGVFCSAFLWFSSHRSIFQSPPWGTRETQRHDTPLCAQSITSLQERNCGPRCWSTSARGAVLGTKRTTLTISCHRSSMYILAHLYSARHLACSAHRRSVGLTSLSAGTLRLPRGSAGSPSIKQESHCIQSRAEHHNRDNLLCAIH